MTKTFYLESRNKNAFSKITSFGFEFSYAHFMKLICDSNILQSIKYFDSRQFLSPAKLKKPHKIIYRELFVWSPCNDFLHKICFVCSGSARIKLYPIFLELYIFQESFHGF